MAAYGTIGQFILTADLQLDKPSWSWLPLLSGIVLLLDLFFSCISFGIALSLYHLTAVDNHGKINYILFIDSLHV